MMYIKIMYNKYCIIMGKIAKLMRKYLDSISEEQLQKDIEDVKALGLNGPTMEEFFCYHKDKFEFVYNMKANKNFISFEDDNLYIAA